MSLSLLFILLGVKLNVNASTYTASDTGCSVSLTNKTKTYDFTNATVDQSLAAGDYLLDLCVLNSNSSSLSSNGYLSLANETQLLIPVPSSSSFGTISITANDTECGYCTVYSSVYGYFSDGASSIEFSNGDVFTDDEYLAYPTSMGVDYVLVIQIAGSNSKIEAKTITITLDDYCSDQFGLAGDCTTLGGTSTGTSTIDNTTKAVRFYGSICVTNLATSDVSSVTATISISGSSKDATVLTITSTLATEIGTACPATTDTLYFYTSVYNFNDTTYDDRVITVVFKATFTDGTYVSKTVEYTVDYANM